MCPWDAEEQGLILSAMDSANALSKSHEQSDVSATDVFVDFLRDELSEFLNGLYHRHGPGMHQFALILKNIDTANLKKAYGIEMKLQMKFPAETFRFDILRSETLENEIAELLSMGYKKVGENI